jgi:hypothetical protein
MRSKACIFCCFLFCLLQLKAQLPDNYYLYTLKMDLFYKNLSSSASDSLRVAGRRDYQRWRDFWQNRVYNSPQVTGNLDMYGSKLQEALGNPAVDPDSSSMWDWQYAGPRDLTTHNRGIISSLYINPGNISEIYAGSNSSGMFRTTDGGLTWQNVTDNLGLPSMGVNDIAVNPVNQDIKYIAINPLYRSGPAFIYKTSDNCISWQRVLSPAPDKKSAIRVILDPTNPSIVYATMQDVVYRSLDAGSSWKLVFNSLTYDPSWYLDHKLLTDIEFKPGDPNTIYIASTGIRNHFNHDASAEVWVTHNATDTLVSWQRFESGLPEYCDRYAICTASQDSSCFYLGYSLGIGPFHARFNLDKVNVSSETIEHVFDKEWWSNYGSAFSGMGYWCNGLEISPLNPEILFIGGYSVQVLNMKSLQYRFYECNLEDKDSHVDQRVFKIVVSNGKTYLFCGNDGGVSRYEYEADEMKSLNGIGLDNNQYYGIGHSEKLPGFYIGGTQDNGIFGNGSGSWNVAVQGDAYEVIIDPVEPRNVYATATGGPMVIVKSVNYGMDFYVTPQPLATGGINNRPFLMSPSDRNTLYVGYSEVFKTTNQCLNWQQISDFHNPANGWTCDDAIGAIGITGANPNVIYAGFINPTWGNGSRRLFKTTNGGNSWVDLTDKLGTIIYDKGITGILVSPLDENKVWISFNGYEQDGSGNTVKKVIYSSDAGDSWTDISYNLPDLPVNRIAGIMANDRYRILICSDIGIFLFDELENSWQNIGIGLPMTIVSDIEVNYTGGELIAGTFGRGIWKSKIPVSLGIENEQPEPKDHQSQNKAFHAAIKPNPADESFTIDFSLPDDHDPAYFKLTDTWGKVVHTYILSGRKGQQIIDTGKFSPGTYLYELYYRDEIRSGKLIVNHQD